MKKHLISLALAVLVSAALLSATAFAQLEAGSVMLGSSTSVMGPCGNSAGFMYQNNKLKVDGEDVKDEEFDTYALNLAPRLGYFFADGLMAGIKLNVEYDRLDLGEDAAIENTGFMGGAFLRYYFTATGEGSIKPFVEVEGLGGRNVFDSGGELESKYDVYQFGGGVGAAILLNDHLTFDLLAGYAYQVGQDPDDKVDAKAITNGVGLALGFSYFIGN